MSSDAVPAVGMKEAGVAPNGAAGENPYLSARRHWNSQTDRAFSAARLWQVYGTAGLLVALASVAGWIHVASEPRYVPYVVEVDKLGEAVAVHPAPNAAQADARVVRASLASFIWSARMVTADVAVERKALFQVWGMLRSKDPATVKIQEWWNEQTKTDPYHRAATETVDVDISSALPLSDSSYQIDWLESVRDRDGNLKEPPYRMRATLSIYTAPLDRRASEAEISANPLGVYVSDFHWGRVN